MPVLTESAAASVEELKRELAGIRRDFDVRIARMEQKLAAASPQASVMASSLQATPSPKSEVSSEVIAIIAAAVTSFLGKKVKIHHAARIDSGTTPWAQQGRAIIQASHNLSR